MVYDPRVGEHHHLICRECGTITDIDAQVDPEALLALARLRGFTPEGAQVAITGVCAECRSRVGDGGLSAGGGRGESSRRRWARQVAKRPSGVSSHREGRPRSGASSGRARRSAGSRSL